MKSSAGAGRASHSWLGRGTHPQLLYYRSYTRTAAMNHAEQLAQTRAMLVRLEDLKTAHLELRIQHLDRMIERELENLAQDEDTTWRHTRQIMADKSQGNPATQDILTRLDVIYDDLRAVLQKHREAVMRIGRQNATTCEELRGFRDDFRATRVMLDAVADELN